MDDLQLGYTLPTCVSQKAALSPDFDERAGCDDAEPP